MPDEVSYYAILGNARTAQTPSGLARRRYGAAGPVDEALRRDLTWEPDCAIVEWEYGEAGANLIEISEAAADRLSTVFQAKWERQGLPYA